MNATRQQSVEARTPPSARPAGKIPAGRAPTHHRAGRAAVGLRRRTLRNLSGYAYIAPAALLFALFAWYPILLGLEMSLQRVTLAEPSSWTGMQNFQLIFHDPVFWTAWGNTLKFSALSLLFGFVVPVGLAICVNEMRHGQWYFRLAFYLPAILPPIVTAFMWNWFLDPGPGGFVNSLLGHLGIGPQPWLNSQTQALYAILAITIWAGSGATMLIYLAALQDIPAELYEAAELDGANLWQRVRSVTLPQIRTVMAAMFVLSFINSMQLFVEPYALTAGGPNHATETVVTVMYEYGFQEQQYGKAAAVGVTLFVVIVLLTIGLVWLPRRIAARTAKGLPG
ncbi:carbohydrate ABC transporter permease [Micromonospora sp. SL1-18]|uniref:carbohydrate ABC transporter permease n=1 Tax=Micromonospora sp. SL1-18 TaxID=3399128 RepID=UPI003A4DBB42